MYAEYPKYTIEYVYCNEGTVWLTDVFLMEHSGALWHRGMRQALALDTQTALASSVNSLLALLFVGFVISVQISPSAKVWVKFMEKIKNSSLAVTARSQ